MADTVRRFSTVEARSALALVIGCGKINKSITHPPEVIDHTILPILAPYNECAGCWQEYKSEETLPAFKSAFVNIDSNEVPSGEFGALPSHLGLLSQFDYAVLILLAVVLLSGGNSNKKPSLGGRTPELGWHLGSAMSFQSNPSLNLFDANVRRLS